MGLAVRGRRAEQRRELRPLPAAARADGACFETFLGALREAVPAGEVALVLDNTGSHTSHAAAWPAGVTPLPLPPYSPEPNPPERLFEALRATLANRVFADREDLERAVTEALRPYWQDPPALRRLTGYPWWLEAVQNITPASA